MGFGPARDMGGVGTDCDPTDLGSEAASVTYEICDLEKIP